MTTLLNGAYVNLTKYIDESAVRPVLRGTVTTVSAVAYRALGGSWDLDQLAHEFCLTDVEILAALLYYEQFKTRIDEQEGDIEKFLDAMD